MIDTVFFPIRPHRDTGRIYISYLPKAMLFTYFPVLCGYGCVLCVPTQRPFLYFHDFVAMLVSPVADASLLGAALVYVLQLGGLFQWSVRQSAEVRWVVV